MPGIEQDFADAVAALSTRTGTATPAVRGSDWQTATVTAVSGDGTVDVGTVRARRLESYTAPQVGDRIMLTRSGGGNWVAVGRCADAGPALGLPGVPIYKPIATDRANATTLTDDPHLTMLLDPGTWLVEFCLLVGAPADGLMTTAWAVPPGATGVKAVQGPGSGASDGIGDNILMRSGAHGYTGPVTYGRRTSPTGLLLATEYSILTTASSGTCAIRWGQATASATATRMGAGSWMRATKIS
ncbi:hypothetical protein [Wenjunlia vitaminophila]|uniref:hypothetical protein n=1 Tax=Wenjunlia vitaminophila TaxID=76728 RepID=UPI0003821B40|nr:hypothetical protein [Wenjunlia vitaminophila]